MLQVKPVSYAFGQPEELLEAMERVDALLVGGTWHGEAGPDAVIGLQLDCLLYKGLTTDKFTQLFTASTGVEISGFTRVRVWPGPGHPAAAAAAWHVAVAGVTRQDAVPHLHARTPTPPRCRS